MQALNILLFNRFGWHEAHAGALHSFTDSLSTRSVILVRLYAWFDELGSYDANVMTQFGKLTTLVV